MFYNDIIHPTVLIFTVGFKHRIITIITIATCNNWFLILFVTLNYHDFELKSIAFKHVIPDLAARLKVGKV